MSRDLPIAMLKDIEQKRVFQKTILFSDVMKQITSLSDRIIWDMESSKVEDSTTWTYSSRVYAVHSWYVRVSHANKRRFMLNLMDRINKMETLCCIMRAIWLSITKDSIYNQQWNNVFTLYDRVTLDNNRMAIPDKLLMKIIRLDLKWFDNLDHACQVRFILGLVPLSGGPIVMAMAQAGRFILVNRFAHRKLSRINGDEESFEKKPTTRLTATAKKFPHVTEKFWNNLNETRKVNAKQFIFEEAIKDLRKELKMDVPLETKLLIMRMASTPKRSANLKPLPKQSPKPKISVPYKSSVHIQVYHSHMDMLQQLPFKVLLNLRWYLSDEDMHNLTRLNLYWTSLWDVIQNCEDVREEFNKQLPPPSERHDLTTPRKKKSDKKPAKRTSKGERKSAERKELEKSFPSLPLIESIKKTPSDTNQSVKFKSDWFPEININPLYQKKRELMKAYTFKEKPKDVKASRAKGAIYLRERLKVKGCMDKSIYAWCAKLLKVEGFEVASTGFETLKAPEKFVKLNDEITKVQEEVQVHYFPRYSLIERPILNTAEKVYYRSLENRRLRPNDVKKLEKFFTERTVSNDRLIINGMDSFVKSSDAQCGCSTDGTIASFN